MMVEPCPSWCRCSALGPYGLVALCWADNNEERNWSIARDYCRRNFQSGDLVVLDSECKTRWMHALFEEYLPNQNNRMYWWIGLSEDSFGEGWTWNNGTGIDEWVNWEPGGVPPGTMGVNDAPQPNGTAEDPQNCVLLKQRINLNIQPTWHDAGCLREMPFICSFTQQE